MIGFTLFHVLGRMKLVPLLTRNRVSKEIYHLLKIWLSLFCISPYLEVNVMLARKTYTWINERGLIV